MDVSELSFFESQFSGEQWESVASWVLNGGGMEVAEKAEEAANSAALSGEYASQSEESKLGAEQHERNAESYANNANTALEKLQNMGVLAQSLPYGSGATVEKIIGEDGSVTLKFGIERGEKGEKGDKGSHATITITQISGGHRVTFTDEDGTQSFDVMNGSADKMDRENPVGSGSFSMNRKAGTTVGNRSFAEGYNATASGNTSHAEGNNTTASASFSHAEGSATTASNFASHAEGDSTTASGDSSHAEGYHTLASSAYQHTQGKYNVEDDNGVYADIVGWGTANNARKNISALDTDGNLHLKGKVFIECEDDSTGGTELGGSDVFIAEYGVTTYQEIDDAYNSGKTILAFDDGRTYMFAGKATKYVDINILTYYRFYTIWTASQGKYIECYLWSDYTNNWNSGYFVQTETTGYKKTVIDYTTKDSNYYYPTTKAVYDFASPKIKVTNVTLATGSWVASGNNYEQTVTISGATENSRIDVQPDATVITRLVDDGVIAIYFQNDSGTIKAVSVGEKPSTNITVQVSITEVAT